MGHCAITAGSTLRVAATIACGVCVNQSDNETSSERGLLNTVIYSDSVLPMFLIQ